MTVVEEQFSFIPSKSTEMFLALWDRIIKSAIFGSPFMSNCRPYLNPMKLYCKFNVVLLEKSWEPLLWLCHDCYILTVFLYFTFIYDSFEQTASLADNQTVYYQWYFLMQPLSSKESTSVNNSYSNKQPCLQTFLFPALTETLRVLKTWRHRSKSTGVIRWSSFVTVVAAPFPLLGASLITWGPCTCARNDWTCTKGPMKSQHLLIAEW